MLKEQISDLQIRLVESSQAISQAQSLKGIETAQLSVDVQVKQQMDEFRRELAHEQLKKDKEALEKRVEELEADLEEKEADIEDLEEQIKGHQRKLEVV